MLTLDSDTLIRYENLGDCSNVYRLPWWSANPGDSGSVPESATSLGEGNGNPLQYSCLGNPMEKEDWQTIVHGVTVTYDLATEQQQF